MSITLVSGFLPVKNKYLTGEYDSWFKNTLSINASYVFFGTSEIIEFVKTIRPDFYFIEISLEEMYCYKYMDSIQTHPVHCPSKELMIIWNEKMFMLQKASKINPFNSEYFMWVDAGISIFREKEPPQTPLKDLNFPLNKIVVTKSKPFFKKTETENYHYLTGGNLLLHHSFVDTFCEMYKRYLDKLVPLDNNCYTDQVILTKIYSDHPELFEIVGYGYGKLLILLLN